MSEKIPDGRFPFGKMKRKREHDYYKEVTKSQTVQEQGNEPEDIYTIYDSPLSSNTGSDASFDISFSKLLERKGKSIRSFIEKSLENKRRKAVGIEFGGPGSNLFAGFSSGFFARSLGVTLADLRDLDKKSRDEDRHHSVIAGNIADLSTYKLVKEWLDAEQADLIIERLAGGHVLIPRDPHLLGQIFQAWYELLADSGLIMAQTNHWMRPVLVPWFELVKHQSKGELGIEYEHGWGNQSDTFDAIFLRKLDGAPQKLPMLDARTIREISKNESSNWV